MTVPGFRKGHVPESMLIQRLGEQVILEGVAGMALKDAYPQIVEDNNLTVVGRPNIAITKLAVGNPIEFKITVAVMPEIVLPDYKNIAKEVIKESGTEEVLITEKEIDDVLLQIRKNKWLIDHKDTKEVEGGKKEPEESELPPLTDTLVKTLGDFKDVADFKAKLTENMQKEKEQQEKSKQRAVIGEKIAEGARITLPRILVESELEKMLGQFKHDVAAMGIQFDEYLKKINKTEEDLRKEWKADAEKRAKLQLSLSKIAAEEHITAKEEDIQRDVDRILGQHKDANPENVRIYVATVLTNEKVFRFLETTAD